MISAVILLVGTIMMGGALALTQVHYRMTLLEIESDKARYITEAGIYRTIAKLKTNAASETDAASNPVSSWKEGVNWIRFGEGNYRVRVVTETRTDRASTSGTRTNESRIGETSNSGPLTVETPSNKVSSAEKADNKGEVVKQAEQTPPVLRLMAEGRLPSGAKSIIQVRYDTDRNAIVQWEETSHE